MLFELQGKCTTRMPEFWQDHFKKRDGKIVLFKRNNDKDLPKEKKKRRRLKGVKNPERLDPTIECPRARFARGNPNSCVHPAFEENELQEYLIEKRPSMYGADLRSKEERVLPESEIPESPEPSENLTSDNPLESSHQNRMSLVDRQLSMINEHLSPHKKRRSRE